MRFLFPIQELELTLLRPNDKPKFPLNSFLFGGLLPIILFTLVEEYYGTAWGLVTALFFGFGELSFELWKYKKISKITLVGNFLIIFLGIISLFTQDGIWFKLQPGIIELGMVLFLWGSLLMKKPLLLSLAQQQNIQLPEVLLKEFPKLTFRIGVFFLIHAALAFWAAFYWSTTAWALLKGVGLMVTFVLYLIIEMWLLRSRIKIANQGVIPINAHLEEMEKR
ncbi:MAG: septation protein IspZ [Deltaproteobacteria bacterium]|jgi:intracellular septation protein|nr:septation protein IspZ [Deltaproteobacteria bacterium]